MSTVGPLLYHPINGTPESTYEGFSWPGLFFGVLWLAYKQMWAHFVITLLICIFTGGLAAIPIWIFYGFTGNGFHRDSLLSKGYLTATQRTQKTEAATSSQDERPASPSIADELTKLVKLRDTGDISPEEFSEQKKRLLAP